MTEIEGIQKQLTHLIRELIIVAEEENFDRSMEDVLADAMVEAIASIWAEGHGDEPISRLSYLLMRKANILSGEASERVEDLLTFTLISASEEEGIDVGDSLKIMARACGEWMGSVEDGKDWILGELEATYELSRAAHFPETKSAEIIDFKPARI